MVFNLEIFLFVLKLPNVFKYSIIGNYMLFNFV